MKPYRPHYSLLAVLIAVSCAGSTTSMASGEITRESDKYTTNGYLTLTHPDHPIVLLDNQGKSVVLNQYTDRTMLLRFIQKPDGRPSEIQIARKNQGKPTVLIPGGFGSDLENFSLSADQIGQNYGLEGSSKNSRTEHEPYEYNRSCSYQCGYDHICQDVPSQVCHTDSDGDDHCETIERRECSDVTRYCDGTERVEVSGYDTRAEFQLAFVDLSGVTQGRFSAVDNETFNSETSLSSCR